MKFILIFSVLVLGLFSVQAFADKPVDMGSLNLNHPGIKWEWKIKAENYTFTVTTTSNYDMQNVTFNKDLKTLTLLGNSSHTDNIAEIEIPKDLLDGNFTVTNNGKQIDPVILKNANLTTIILKFNETGITTTDIMGTTYLPEFSGIAPLVVVISFTIMFAVFRLRKF